MMAKAKGRKGGKAAPGVATYDSTAVSGGKGGKPVVTGGPHPKGHGKRGRGQ